MVYTLKEISDVLNNDDIDEKISVLSCLTEITDSKIIREIVSVLDDKEIRVRGEAFSSLFLNCNDISEVLISNLTNESKNIRGFCALILANRGNVNSIDSLIDLTKDTSGMVRSCAFGALGHLRAKQAKKLAIEAYLEAKRIKSVYLLDQFDSESDSDSEFEDNELILSEEQ